MDGWMDGSIDCWIQRYKYVYANIPTWMNVLMY
jgi:hypothetical protein